MLSDENDSCSVSSDASTVIFTPDMTPATDLPSTPSPTVATELDPTLIPASDPELCATSRQITVPAPVEALSNGHYISRI